MIALGSVSDSIITGGNLNIHQPEKPYDKKSPETNRTSITSYSQGEQFQQRGYGQYGHMIW